MLSTEIDYAMHHGVKEPLCEEAHGQRGYMLVGVRLCARRATMRCLGTNLMRGG